MKKLSEFQKITILQVLTCLVLILVMWYMNYKRPLQYVSDPNLTNEIRKANAEQRAALIKQQEEAEKSTAYFLKKDSLNDIKLDENSNAITKFKKESNDKINSIRNYSSAELVRAFAELGKGQ